MSTHLISDLDNAPCGFLTFTDSGIVKSINNTLILLLGYEQRGLIEEKNIETLFTLSTRIFYQTHFFPLLNLHGKANEIFLTLKKKDGETLPVICNALRKKQDSHYINHCIFIPIQERSKYEQEILQAKKQAEDALKENKELIKAKKELELNSIDLDRRINRLRMINEDIIQFSQAISHDLQEPIRKIAIWSNKMIEEINDTHTGENAKELEKINKECIKLRSLAVNLEKYISLNIKTEEFIELNLAEIIQQCFSKVIDETGQSNISLTVNPLPVVEGYKSQMQLLFVYIFENYLRFRDPSRPLQLSIEGEKEQVNSYKAIKNKYRYVDIVKIFLSGSGGLENKSREFAFLMNKKTDIRSIGLGFGFGSAKKIIENHFGSITAVIDSDSGIKLIISLPLKQLTASGQ